MRIIWSQTDSPAYNAAFEECLFREEVTETTLFLYQNSPSVLMGRNQNPWAETDVAYCQAHGIPLIRRISGGGTVYHDSGNVNYAFILKRSDYKPEKYVSMIAEVLESLGVPTLDINPHFSIYAGAKKIAGTSFALTQKAALLHGCILVTTDLQQLNRVLEIPAGQHVEGPGVASNRTAVVNAAELMPGLTATVVRDAIVQDMQRREACGQVEMVSPETMEDTPGFLENLAKFTEDLWTYGHTPDFVLQLNEGQGLLSLAVSSGVVRTAVLVDSTGCQSYLPELTGKTLLQLTIDN